MLKSSIFKFVLPFNYLYFSRLKKKAEFLSLVWIYLLFLSVFLFGFYGLALWPNGVSFLLGFFAWLCIYEIGYLENDALTIRNEKHPNIRISQWEIRFIQEHYWRIVILRLIIFLALLGVLVLLGLFTSSQLKLFLLVVGAGRLFFFLHNRIRSRWNILTYLLLCLSKYWVFPLVYLGFNFELAPYWVIFLTFPLLRTLEHAIKPKYRFLTLKNWMGSLDVFRVRYYGLWLVVAILHLFFFEGSKILVYSLAYFFLFRLGIFFLIGTGIYIRSS